MPRQILQWFFRNRQTGAITVAQAPNLVFVDRNRRPGCQVDLAYVRHLEYSLLCSGNERARRLGRSTRSFAA